MKKSLLFLCALISIIFLCSAYADIENEGAIIPWSYLGNTGPSRWANLNSDFLLCAQGKEQSPINLPHQTQILSANLIFKYNSSPLSLILDGDTNLNIGTKHYLINDGHSIQVNFSEKGVSELLIFKGQPYRLVQFHFHSPSENLLQGSNYPLEVHLVHQGQDGKVLVVGVFIKAGEANPVLEKIIRYLPKQRKKQIAIAQEKVDPMNLLPASKSYYSFAGSLTTPPCTQGVQWIIMAQPISAGTGQIVSLRQAMGGVNARPVQPLYARKIFYSN